VIASKTQPQVHPLFPQSVFKGHRRQDDDALNMAALRPFLSSIRILLILDSVETNLDPHQPEAAALCPAIEGLSEIKSTSLTITTRISTVPATCRQVEVPLLSIAPAREIFYNIHPAQDWPPKLIPCFKN